MPIVNTTIYINTIVINYMIVFEDMFMVLNCKIAFDRDIVINFRLFTSQQHTLAMYGL